MPKIEYKLADGTKVPSVTQIIGATLGYGLNGLCYYNWAQGKAGADWQADMKRKGAIGTLVHDLIEGNVDPAKVDALKLDGDFGIAASMFLRHCAWPGRARYAIMSTETSMVSEKLRIGGTVDACVLTENAEIGIIDYKTSKSVRESYILQLAAYREIYQEVTKAEVEFCGVVHLKDDGWPELYIFGDEDLDRAYEAFLHCLALYKLQSPLGKAVRAARVKEDGP